MEFDTIKFENHDIEIKYEDIFNHSDKLRIKFEPIEADQSKDFDDTEDNDSDKNIEPLENITNVAIKNEYGAEMLYKNEEDIQIKKDNPAIENADFSKIFIEDNNAAIADLEFSKPQPNMDQEGKKHNSFNCPHCPFTTKYKTCIQRHRLLHKKPEECTAYFCDVCNFKTIHRISMKNHLSTDRHLDRLLKDDSNKQIHNNLVHIIEPDQKPLIPGFIQVAAELLSCEICPYQTRSKMNYSKHLFTHKNSSECTIYKCDICFYETKRKSSITNHLLTHKKLEEVTKTFECDLCDYKSKYLSCMSTHKLTHKDIKEVRVFKCKKCPYQAKYKKSLNRHILYTKCALKNSATETMEEIINAVAVNITTNVSEPRLL